MARLFVYARCQKAQIMPARGIVTIVYKGKKEQYRLYENKIALDLITVRKKLAPYFFMKGNWSGSNRSQAKAMKERDAVIAQSIKQLRAIAKLYNIDYKKLKNTWEQWWHDHREDSRDYTRFNHDARVIVTLPIKHTPIKLVSETSAQAASSSFSV